MIMMKRRAKRSVLRRLGGLFGGLSGGGDVVWLVGFLHGVASGSGGLGLGFEAVSFGVTRSLRARGGRRLRNGFA